ncbi:hypothetical protein JCM14469_12200 [Desulfatiferula olefinivorans]
MKTSQNTLVAGLIVSMTIHLALLVYFRSMESTVPSGAVEKTSILVPVTMTPSIRTSEPEAVTPPPPEPPPARKKAQHIVKRTPSKKQPLKPAPVPVSHEQSTTKPPTSPDAVTPVFGVSRNSVAEASPSGFTARVGNTLMKEQEEAFTPIEKVRDYRTFPVFELTTLPEFLLKITPEYPVPLKDEDREGEVALSVSIDDAGRVTHVKVLRASHRLFAQASVEAVKKSRFKPATRNGTAVGTVLDDLVYTFILDE